MSGHAARVAVVFGGLSAERKVSEVTSSKVEEALRERGYTTARIELTADLGITLPDWQPTSTHNSTCSPR